MELRQLRYFVAVADALSFRQAANRLRIAQPSLSAQVGKLEKKLGVRLFDRDRRHVSLTPAGAVFLGEAKEILARADVGERRARDAAEGRSGELRIGHAQVLTPMLLPQCLAAFSRASPQTVVTLHDLGATDQLQRLADGAINIGFLTTPFPALPRRRQFLIHRLLSGTIMVMVNSRHPLAAQTEVSTEDLKDVTFLHVRMYNSDSHRVRTEVFCRNHGFRPRIGQGVESIESLVGLVAASQGVALIPAFSIQAAAECTFVPLAGTAQDYELYTVWAADGASGVQQQFLQIVLREAKKAEGSLAALRKRHGGKGAALHGVEPSEKGTSVP